MSNPNPQRGRQLHGPLSQPRKTRSRTHQIMQAPQPDTARGTPMYPRDFEHIGRCKQCLQPTRERDLKYQKCPWCRSEHLRKKEQAHK